MWLFGGSKDNSTTTTSTATIARRGSDPGLMSKALESNNNTSVEEAKEIIQGRDVSTSSNASTSVVAHSKSLPNIPT